MVSQLFLGISLLGAEWVLWVLIGLSILSVAVIIERAMFYRRASQGLESFRMAVRAAGAQGQWDQVLSQAKARTQALGPDLETEMVLALAAQSKGASAEMMGELAQDAVMRAKLQWERGLSVLATIGANAPFVGLFGTVLGIIKAFHDLSHQAATGAQGVSAGISEALVATAVGLLVAIPAVVAFNLFQRRVRAGLTQAEAMKSYIVGRMLGR